MFKKIQSTALSNENVIKEIAVHNVSHVNPTFIQHAQYAEV